MLEIGTKAPAFSLPDQNGDMHTLEDYKGKKGHSVFLSERQHGGMYKTGMRFCGAVSRIYGKKMR